MYFFYPASFILAWFYPTKPFSEDLIWWDSPLKMWYEYKRLDFLHQSVLYHVGMYKNGVCYSMHSTSQVYFVIDLEANFGARKNCISVFAEAQNWENCLDTYGIYCVLGTSLLLCREILNKNTEGLSNCQIRV
jgi:hypothetical protein